MVPADQRFGTNHLTSGKVNLRLVMQDKFIIFKCSPQAIADMQVLDGIFIHFLIEEAPGAAPRILGPVHCCVGLPEQGIEITAIVRIDADADGAGGAEFIAVDVKQFLQSGEDIVGNLRDGFVIHDFREHDEKFVAALAADDVGFAQAFAEPLRNLFE